VRGKTLALFVFIRAVKFRYPRFFTFTVMDSIEKGLIRMTTQLYSTTELKLAALLVSEIPDCSIEVYEHANSLRKLIKIEYPSTCKGEVTKLEKAFINKEAITNIYSYNKALNLIRDRLRGKNGRSNP
jgi:hypothetical protein